MPIDTPEKALLLTELPTASANDTGIQAIVYTSVGAKKLPIQQIFEPYNILIGAYLHYSHHFPTSFAVPLLGGILDPEDFEDRLVTFKQRIPNDWILDDGKVQLPMIMDHVLQQDIKLQPGELQDDALQNITGNLTLPGRGGTGGAFAIGGPEWGQASRSNTNENWTARATFDASRVARTAARTRERTLNTVLCILTGKNTATQTKRYYMIDPDHGESLGYFIDLAIGKNGEGIGYNPLVMTENEPKEITQGTLATLWGSSYSCDPLGLAMQMKITTAKKWPFEYFDEIYRTFRIAGKDVFITGSATGITIIGGNGDDSITFSGTPAYQTNSLWNSSYGVAYSSTSVLINGRDFSAFTITGLPSVDIWFRVKEAMAILSLKSNNNKLDSTWWNQLIEKCPSEKKENLQAWLNRMPYGIFNAANPADDRGESPQSRFYFFSSKYDLNRSDQIALRQKFQSARVEDNLGLYTTVQSESEFSLENFVNHQSRTFWFLGKKLTLSCDRTGVKWSDEDGYYWLIKATPEVGNFANIDSQNKQIRYQFTAKDWYFGGPGIAEINTTDGYSGSILLFVKEETILLSNSVYFDFSKVQVVLSKAPQGREEDLKKVFDHLPQDWENTLNQDNIGNNNGTREARFWMQGNANE